jgi:hypothetical protein
MSQDRSLRAADQIVNSASSALYSIGLVGTTNNERLGAIAIAMTALPLLLGLARTSVHEAILFQTGELERRRLTWLAAVAGCACALIAFATTLVLGVLVDLNSTTVFAVAGASFGVLLFDGLRFAAFADDRVELALFADCAWLIVTGSGILVMWISDGLNVNELSWWYGGAAIASCVVFAPVVRAMKRTDVPHALRSQVRFGSDFLLQVLPGQLALVIASLVASLAAVGEIRAAVTLYSPLATAVYAVRLMLIDRLSDTALSSVIGVYATIATLYTVILTASFQLLPALARTLGSLPTAVLLLVGVGEVARHISQAFVDAVRVVSMLRPAVVLRGAQAILLVACSGLLGAAWGGVGLSTARLVAFGVPLLVAAMIPGPWRPNTSQLARAAK